MSSRLPEGDSLRICSRGAVRRNAGIRPYRRRSRRVRLGAASAQGGTACSRSVASTTPGKAVDLINTSPNRWDLCMCSKQPLGCRTPLPYIVHPVHPGGTLLAFTMLRTQTVMRRRAKVDVFAVVLYFALNVVEPGVRPLIGIMIPAP